jgi:hypothetical protein
VAGISTRVAGYGYQATIWKDGAVIFTGQGTANFVFTSAYGIAVNGPDVYFAGDYNSNSAPVYWKNGVAHQISWDSQTTISAIAVNDQDIYLLGYKIESLANNTFTLTRFLWNNGVTTELATASQSLRVGTNIALNGSDVYVAGATGYWKNSTLTQLNGQGVSTSAIAVVPR